MYRREKMVFERDVFFIWFSILFRKLWGKWKFFYCLYLLVLVLLVFFFLLRKKKNYSKIIVNFYVLIIGKRN